MRFSAVCVTFCVAVAQAAALPSIGRHRETLEEAAVFVKSLVHRVSTGTMASVFPASSDNAGRPFALMEAGWANCLEIATDEQYHAPCHPSPSLTFLLLPISLSSHNILASDSHYATYTVQTPLDQSSSPMSQGRVAFMGNVTLLRDLPADEAKELAKCYISYHPDAKRWLPDAKDSPHLAVWARFDMQDIYYVGGFGDVHYIGHIPIDLYARSGEEDVSSSLRIQA